MEKKNVIVNRTLSAIVLCIGLSLWLGFASQFRNSDRFSVNPNLGCIKGSPYGKIAALAMQGPIGVYFHQGESHATAVALRDEPAQKVDERSDEHAEGCDCGAHDEGDPDTAQLESGQPEFKRPLHQTLKSSVKKMAGYSHRRTNGQKMSPQHQHYLQSVNEDKLNLAYELDPSNYTNYGNYHLFLSMNDFGKSKMDEDAALALAKKTIVFCKKEEVDPASWLTAASAAYNIITYIGRHYEDYTVDQVNSSLSEFDRCMQTHQRLLAVAVEKGFVVSQVKLDEMIERARFLGRLREAQGLYLKRKMNGG